MKKRGEMDDKNMKTYFENDFGKLYNGNSIDILKNIESESVNCCVTSPPYFRLRNYNVENQIGLEQTPDEYVQKMVEVFREIKRVLKKDGTLWLNLGDSYNGSGKNFGHKNGISKICMQASNKGSIGLLPTKVNGLKPKDLIGIPWRVAFALQNDGWYLRSDIIWHKTNAFPESVLDRPSRSHEYIFLLSKSRKYYYDCESIKEPSKFVERKSDINKSKDNRKFFDKTMGGGGTSFKGHSGYYKEDGTPIGTPGKRNKRSVWIISTKPFSGAHFATFPPDLIKPCILAGCPENGIVLDPFFGSGTTGYVSQMLNRRWIGIDLNKDYCDIASDRLQICSFKELEEELKND